MGNESAKINQYFHTCLSNSRKICFLEAIEKPIRMGVLRKDTDLMVSLKSTKHFIVAYRVHRWTSDWLGIDHHIRVRQKAQRDPSDTRPVH